MPELMGEIRTLLSDRGTVTTDETGPTEAPTDV